MLQLLISLQCAVSLTNPIPLVAAHNDSVDQTTARSLGDVIENQWRSCVSHTTAGFLKWLLEKTVCQNVAGVLGRLKSLSLSI